MDAKRNTRFRLLLLNGLLLGGMLGGLPAQDQEAKHVLILNSYHPGYEWTDSLVRSISMILDSQSYQVELWIEYMDSRRFYGAEHFQELDRLYQHKYSRRKLDLIISTDDAALEFLLQYRLKLFGNVPVVFCGVNNHDLAARAPTESYTGVLEVFDSKGILDLALKLHPGTQHLYIVTDNSPTSIALRQDYETEKPRYQGLDFNFLDGRFLSFAEILETLRKAPHQSVVITTSFNRDKTGIYIPKEKAHAMLAQASSAPVYGPSISILGQGIVGGTENGGESHGQITGRLAVKVLGGTVPPAIPRIYDREARFIFDREALRKWGISRWQLPANAAIFDPHPSFYEANQALILGGGFFILFELLIIAGLVYHIIMRRRAKQAVQQKAAELVEVNLTLQEANESLRIEAEHHRCTLAALRETEHRFILAVGAAKVGIWEYHPETDRFHLGTGFQSILDYQDQDLDLWNGIIHPEDVSFVRAAVQAHLEGRPSENLSECRMFHRDGSVRWVLIRGSLVTGTPEKPPRLIGTMLDVTERKRLEERSQQAEKLQSLGKLAGGIAHDFNNLLTVINGYSSLILETLDEKDPSRDKDDRDSKCG